MCKGLGRVVFKRLCLSGCVQEVVFKRLCLRGSCEGDREVVVVKQLVLAQGVEEPLLAGAARRVSMSKSYWRVSMSKG